MTSNLKLRFKTDKQSTHNLHELEIIRFTKILLGTKIRFDKNFFVY